MPRWRSSGLRPCAVVRREARSRRRRGERPPRSGASVRHLPEALKRVFNKIIQDQEKAERRHRGHDHIRHQAPLGAPVEQQRGKGKGAHQPRPEQQRSRLAAPQRGDQVKVGGIVAGGLPYIGDAEFVIQHRRRSAHAGRRQQGKGHQRRVARADDQRIPARWRRPAQRPARTPPPQTPSQWLQCQFLRSWLSLPHNKQAPSPAGCLSGRSPLDGNSPRILPHSLPVAVRYERTL